MGPSGLFLYPVKMGKLFAQERFFLLSLVIFTSFFGLSLNFAFFSSNEKLETGSRHSGCRLDVCSGSAHRVLEIIILFSLFSNVKRFCGLLSLFSFLSQIGFMNRMKLWQAIRYSFPRE